MPTLKLNDLQAKVWEIVSAVSSLASEVVITDDGTKHDEIETALAGRGIVVVVGPVTSAEVMSQANGLGIVRANLAVEVWENPEQNSQYAQKNAVSIAAQIAVVIAGWTPSRGECCFEIGDNAVELIASQPGLRGYAVSVSKPVQISAVTVTPPQPPPES